MTLTVQSGLRIARDFETGTHGGITVLTFPGRITATAVARNRCLKVYSENKLSLKTLFAN